MKIANLQAYNPVQSDALWACRSAVFTRLGLGLVSTVISFTFRPTVNKMFCLHICVLFYVCLWEKWAYTGSFYKKGIGSFTRVIVIHSVCSISIIVFSILLFSVLYMLGSVQPKAWLCLFNEWYVCVMWKYGCVYQMKTRVPFCEHVKRFDGKELFCKGMPGFSNLCVMFGVLCVQFWKKRTVLKNVF